MRPLWGIGLSPDSTTYVRVASGLFHKSAFREMAGVTDGFPPLYPMVLAAVAKIASGVVSGARWLNAILFGANVLLISMAIRGHTDSLYAALFSSLLVLSAIGLLEIHFMAWSEPLFLVLRHPWIGLAGCLPRPSCSIPHIVALGRGGGLGIPG